MAGKTYDMVVNHILENQQKFYRIAYCYVNNKESALDIVQNAIVKALEASATLKNPDAVKTWFYRILVNEAITFIRKSKKEIVCEPTEMKEEIYYEPAYEGGLSLYMEIHTLPTDMQTVIMLHFFEQLTLKEIAQVTNTNLNTVKSRLYGALDKLKKVMEEVS